MLIEFALFLIGLVFLVKGAEGLISSGVKIARHFGLSDLVIGLTLVGIGTSFPELSIAIISSFKGHSSVMMGNIIGENIFNIFILTSIIGFASRYYFKDVEILQRDIVWLLLCSIWITLIAMTGIISPQIGIVLISLYLIYLVYLYMCGNGLKSRKKPVKKTVLLVLAVSLLLIYAGANLVVANIVKIAYFLGVREWVISSTLLVIGTSFPEVITTLIAVRKKKLKMGVGTLIGSNIFNLLILIGLASIIRPIPIDFYNNIPSFLFLMISSVYIAIIAIRGSFHKKSALIAIFMYLVYLVLLFST